MRTALVLVLSLALAACATFRNPITLNQLAVVESSYGIALSVAVAYRKLRLCKRTEAPSVTNICAQRAVILQLQKADLNAQAALVRARSFIAQNPTIDASSVIQLAQAAVDAMRALEQQYGVGG